MFKSLDVLVLQQQLLALEMDILDPKVLAIAASMLATARARRGATDAIYLEQSPSSIKSSALTQAL